MTVETGHFDVLRRSFERVSDDQRIQAIIIAFCFGALLEALAGFGTPGRDHGRHADRAGVQAGQGRDRGAGRQHRAGRVRRAGHPDHHAGPSGVSNDPRLSDANTLAPSARWSAGRRRSWRVFVPLAWCSSSTAGAACGRRGCRRCSSAASSSRVAQFVTSNYVSVAAHRHRRLAAVRRLGGAAGAGLAAGRGADVEQAERGELRQRGGRGRCRRRRRSHRSASTATATATGAGHRRPQRPAGPAGRVGRQPGRRAAGPTRRTSSSSRSSRIANSRRSWTSWPRSRGPTIFDWPGLDILQRRGRAGDHRDVQVQLAGGGRHAAAHRRPDHHPDPAGSRRPGAEDATSRPTCSCARRSSR